MDNKETLKILHDFQCWRRGKNMEMPDPTLIGNAIDNAIRLLRKEKLKETISLYSKTLEGMGVKPPYSILVINDNRYTISSKIRSEFNSEQEMIEFFKYNNIKYE